MKTTIIFSIALATFLSLDASAQTPLYLDESAPVDMREDPLLSGIMGTAFVTPHGTYIIEVGASSADIRATGSVSL